MPQKSSLEDGKNIAVALAALLSLMATDGARGQMAFPREPEEDNREYVLDAVTNDNSRLWREVWDAGDNRFRMRVGSNNVAQWFLEEQLKFSANLIEHRLRFRFHHARLLRYSSERLAGDTFEFEVRAFDDNYVSAYATPTSVRAENAIGLVLQNRRAVDRYSLFFIDFPHVVRNFTEDRKGTSDSLNVVFTDKPVRLGLNVRERLHRGIWLRLEGELVPEFTVAEEDRATGSAGRSEKIKARSLAGWLETNWPQTDPLPARSAIGIEAGYRRDERTEGSTFLSGAQAPGEAVAPLTERSDRNRPRGAGGLILMEFDKDLYWISPDDSVTAWCHTRTYGKPYAWIVLNDRWTVRAAVLIEMREIRRRNRQSVETSIENRYVAPAAGARLGLGARRRATVEMGWASLFRRREERTGAGPPVETDIDDHRIYAAFEYAFGPDRIVRLVEAFDLDARDRGQYGIHDHAFVQMIIGF
jgi:hypothetical protein